ncbi:PIG-L deacetylase family protein [Leptospira borgpetersenii]|uniref:PIG-L deacetylase family protein n=1 Tax=Leptospira borgpetersenii TaxID=174 RepID=UPI000774D378|nr:PIG-L deacetylase family protein [Leptospira borgpetersenii]MBE8398954.1 PIG-L family deacetylase [Leptospira borgpetersenii serovar Tarassovi]MBE8402059.1 PIG-L family deacetylase [Leptospira borgpetersenii serovar Tarassovi]MBE8406323.1 PIG-L family deacetylase [Leptospira borgpetersenii serovar Tarassovi]MBE8411479.1 PIG-L family deacetylase [Leptospira borgpetersenii serovar Tarassovi]MBE8414907.1 PIG-L family deacetylase [Leptospira borgpetersenii serovar Tarassovi]
MNKKILTVAAHPDDEILGCGATMARLSEEGYEIHILILAEGLTSRENVRDRNSKLKELGELAQTASKASEVIGAKFIEVLDFPDNRMDSIDRLDIIKVVERKIEEIQPEIIFTHFKNDLNIDHRVTSDAVITACRPYPKQVVKELYFFEVPSNTEWQVGNQSETFNPNYFVSINETQMKKKINALKVYQSEMREFPHARSIEAINALVNWRGASIGVGMAEAFVVGRKLI